MKFFEKLKESVINFKQTIYDTACGCGTKKLNKKGKIVAVVVIVLLTLIISNLISG